MARAVRYRVAAELRPSGGVLTLGADRRHADQTEMLMGKLAEQGKAHPVWWSFQQECVVGVFGKRGSGKSYTLGVFLEGLSCDPTDSTIGGNTGDRAALVFDTLSIFQYSLVRVSGIGDAELRATAQRQLRAFGLEEKDLRIRIGFPAGTGQPFYPDNYEQFAINTSFIGPEDYAHIFEINLYRDPMGQLLLAAHDKILESGYEVDGEHIAACPDAGLAELVACLENDPDLEHSFSPETTRALLARLHALLRMPLFSEPPTQLPDLLRPGEVRVLLLGRLSPPLRSVVAALLTRQIFNARSIAAEASKFLRLRGELTEKQREDAEEIVRVSPPRTVICIDEAQGYAPPTRSNPCTEVLIQYVKEGRNHGLSLLFTSQQPSAVHPEVLSQMDAIIAHRLTVVADIEAILKNAKGRRPEKISSGGTTLSESALLKELGQGQAWVSHGDAPRAFVMQVRPRISAHGGIEG